MKEKKHRLVYANTFKSSINALVMRLWQAVVSQNQT